MGSTDRKPERCLQDGKLMMIPFDEALAACRLGNEVAFAADPVDDFDEGGRDTRCAICRDELCICGNCYDCEHDTDQRHGWTSL